MDNRNFAARNVGVRVRFGYATVCCPARVPDADLPEYAFFFGCVFHIGNAPHAANALDFVVIQYGDAR